MAKIDATNKTINSGFCSGKKQVDIKQVLNDASKVCKGTFRSYCNQSGGKSVEIEKEHNSGAFSGKDGKGGYGDKDSKVIGTLQSFNIGIPLGSEPLDHMTFTKISGKPEKKIYEDKLFGCGSYGTLGSFNAIGSGSRIHADGATINSGCGAGNNADDIRFLKAKIDENDNLFRSYQCWGTVKSFNAASDTQIYVVNSKLNKGAFAGIATKQGGSSRGSKYN